jgi:hypothetical protein
MPRRTVLPVLAVAATLGACGGSGVEPRPLPPPPAPGIQVVNDSARDVLVRWYPKADEPSRGSSVVAPCATALVRIPAGTYTVVVSTPAGPVSFGWIVTSQLRCCLLIDRRGRPEPTTTTPPPVRCG